MKHIINVIIVLLLTVGMAYAGPSISTGGGAAGAGTGDMLWSGASEVKLSNVPDLDGGVSSYVLTSTGIGTQPIFTNVTAAAVETDSAALAALNTHTDAAAFSGSGSGVSNFAPKASLTAAVEAAAFSGTTGFQLKTAHTSAVDAAAFSGTTGFALKTALTASTDAITSGGTNFIKSGVTPTFINNISGGVSNFITGVTPEYVNSLTSSVQAQLDDKQPLDPQLTDLGDGTFSQNYVNTAFPWEMEEILSGETVANRIRILPSMTGKGGFFLRAKSDASDYELTDSITISGLTLPLATTSAGVTDSVATIRFDPTASQLISGVSAANVSGVTEAVVGGVTEFISVTISGVTSVDPDDDHYLLELPYNITLKDVRAIQRRNAGSTAAGVPTTINIQECTTALSCTDMIATDWILSGSTTAWVKNSVFSDSVGSKGNSLKLDIVSGASNSDLTVTIHYWINRE